MDREIFEYIEKVELRRNINELRDVLNEICVTAEDTEDLEKRLTVSQRLDELIVKYMTQKDE